MAVVNVEILKRAGACDKDCDLLLQLFPDGRINLVPAELPRIREKGIYAFYAVRLLSDKDQRAVAAALASRAGVPEIVTQASGGNQHIEDRRRELQESQKGDVEQRTALAGFTYSFARFAKIKLSSSANSDAALTAMDTLRQWYARVMKVEHGTPSNESMQEAELLVFQMLSDNGVDTALKS